MTATVTTDPEVDKSTGTGTSRGTGGARSRLPRIPDRIRQGGLPYLLLLPAVLLELLIHIIPMVIGIVMSFRQLTQFFINNWGAAPWTGLDNYSIAVDFDAPIGEALLHSFLVTCVFTFFSVGLAWLFGVTAAILLQENFRGRGFLRAVFLVPYALPVYAAVITWAFMFQRDNGLINHVLHDQLGITDEPSFWLIGDNSIYTLIIVSVWKGWPFAFLMLMAGLQNIPRELYEAASIDGAGDSAADPPDHAALAAPGQPGPGPRALPVDVQRLQHPVRPVREIGPGERGPDLDPHLPVVVRHLELRHWIRDVGPAAALPAGRDGRLPVPHLARKEGLRCLASPGRPAPPGRGPARRWPHRSPSSGPAASS